MPDTLPNDPSGAAAAQAAATAAADTARTLASSQADAARRLPTPDEVKALQASFDAFAASQGKPQAEQTAPAVEKPAEQPGAEKPAELPSQPYDLGLPVETSAAQVLETQKNVHAIVTGLGFDAETAHGHVAMLAKAQAAHGAKPMTPIEHNKVDAILRDRWGDQFDARMDRAHTTLKNLGEVNGTRLQYVLNTVDPLTCAQMLETLSRERA